jgi:hypothetical protein
MGRLIFLVALALLVLAIVKSLPDIRRYLEIRRM